MWRTREWWSALDKAERVQLVWLERLSSRPAASKVCRGCGKPINAGPLCLTCMRRMCELVRKANDAAKAREAA
jgi:hypothetical protein